MTLKKLINIYGIAAGMSYIHSICIIHRQIFILTPKIGDFGLSTRFFDTDNITLQSISGIKCAPIYAAPEVMQNNVYVLFK